MFLAPFGITGSNSKLVSRNLLPMPKVRSARKQSNKMKASIRLLHNFFSKEDNKCPQLEGLKRMSLVAIEPLRDDFRFCGLFKELTVAAFSYLSWGDLVRCQLVCKQWRSLICTTDDLWTANCLARGLPVEKEPFSAFMDAMWHFAHIESPTAVSVDQWGEREVTPQQQKVLEGILTIQLSIRFVNCVPFRSLLRNDEGTHRLGSYCND